jgi:SP family sugar:H+ symporter-like MFS transporter
MAPEIQVPILTKFRRYDTGTVSGILAMSYWDTQFSTGYRDSTGHPNVSPLQSSEVLSILSAGSCFGALAAAPFGDFMGRRIGLIASCTVFIFGVILQIASTALPMFLAGRFVAGLGVGLVSALGYTHFPRITTYYTILNRDYSHSISV